MTKIRSKLVTYPETPRQRTARLHREYMRRRRSAWWWRAVAKAQAGLEAMEAENK